MSREGRRGLALLGIAAGLGIMGDVLFVGHPLGVNVLLLALAFVASLALVLRVGPSALHQGRRWMAAPLLLFAAAFAWHASALLAATNLLALAGAISLGALRRTQPRPQNATIGDYAAGLAAAGAGTLAGSIDFLQRDVPWDEATRSVRSESAASVGRGAAIGLPLLLVFGGLFAAADAVFRDLLTAALPAAALSPWPHLVVPILVAWAAAGLLRDLAEDREERRLVPAHALLGKRPHVRIGGTEIVVALVALDLLFAAFVAVQARYLFGGGALVQAREHLTYAQYARHGFFELVAVSALVVPVILVANAAARERIREVRVLTGLLIALELVVAASALQRMHVYVDEYGLTELRMYSAGVMLWLVAILLWAYATVLRGNGRRFAVGAVVAGFVATAALNVANPDALIAKTNFNRPHPDTAYLAHLSDDAVPALVARVPVISDRALQRELAAMLLARQTDVDLLGWNASRSHARSLIASHRSELEALAAR
jgi:hypothetical protein